MKSMSKNSFRFKPKDLFTLFIGAAMAGAMVVAWDWPLRASIIVLVLGSIGVVLVATQLALDLTRSEHAGGDQTPALELPSFTDDDTSFTRRGIFEIWAWLIGLLLTVLLIGLPLALCLFVFLYAKLYGSSWVLSISLAFIIALFEYGIYDRIMHVYWPEPLLWQLFG